MKTINSGIGDLFFLDAPGGTGKTFLIKLVLATIRSHNEIAIALASSGIAATLLPGGRTAHSALKLPLNINNIETPTCNVSKSSGMGKLLQKCKFIVWDESTMAHKKSVEALDRTLQYLRGNKRLFGNTTILLAGDFRQTLPVITRSTKADELNACLKFSRLWRHVNTLTLTTNMRVKLKINKNDDNSLFNCWKLVTEMCRLITFLDEFHSLMTSAIILSQGKNWLQKYSQTFRTISTITIGSVNVLFLRQRTKRCTP
jgi:hypothetical protein